MVGRLDLAECRGMPTAPALRGPHRTRPIRFVELHELAGWRLKVYLIQAPGSPPAPPLIAAALDVASDVLPAAERDDGPGSRHFAVGFVVVHQAADFAFVLVDWWAGENEVHQHLHSAPLDRPDQLRPHPGQAVGCVWELAVVDFERRAWLRHVLANPDGPDLEAYLDARAHDDV